MSPNAVEVVRRAYEAFNRGDLDGVVEYGAPDFEYVATGAIPGAAGTYRGTEEYRRFLDWWWGEFDEPEFEVQELIDAGDQVFASTTMRGYGKQSGAETSWGSWQVWTVRDGTVLRGQAFPSRDQALEAAGLRE